MKKSTSNISGEIIDTNKEVGELHRAAQNAKLGTLIESQYILTNQEIEMKKKFDRHEHQKLKSVIVHKDEETLIVSQHIPLASESERSTSNSKSEYLSINGNHGGVKRSFKMKSMYF